MHTNLNLFDKRTEAIREKQRDWREITEITTVSRDSALNTNTHIWSLSRGRGSIVSFPRSNVCTVGTWLFGVNQHGLCKRFNSLTHPNDANSLHFLS